MENLAAGEKVRAPTRPSPRSSAPEDDQGAGRSAGHQVAGRQDQAQGAGRRRQLPPPRRARTTAARSTSTASTGPARTGPSRSRRRCARCRPDSYGIGLPFQGQFFPKDEYLKERKKAAGDPPPDITEPSLEKFVGTRYTSTFKDGKWEDKKAGGQAIDRLKSATLKAAIAELNGKGYKIYVFPDNDSHIHIQNP